MGKDTAIAWTDHTFNPWWGCQRVSPGCKHCYAETFSKRVGLKVWGPSMPRRFFGDKHWAEPLKWNRDAKRDGVRRRVFCASMADVAEDLRDLDDSRRRLEGLVSVTPYLDWLLLSKRPEKMPELLWPGLAWPENVWAGTTCEDQEYADLRTPHLQQVPARVRFLSVEPQLGPVNVSAWLTRTSTIVHFVAFTESAKAAYPIAPTTMRHCGIDWVIVGGESGPGARPFDLAWARSIVAQCKAAEVACFVKQLGAKPFDSQGPIVDGDLTGTRITEVVTIDRKGGDPSEWPPGLCVREFPTVSL